MKKFIKNLPYISGLIIILISILFLNIDAAISSFIGTLAQVFFVDKPIIFILSALVTALYVYLLVLFFIKIIQAYREKNSFSYYFIILVAIMALVFFVPNLILGIIFYLNNSAMISESVFLISFALNSFIIFVLSGCLFYFKKSKESFIVSKEKRKNILKMFTLNIGVSVIAFFVTFFTLQYIRPLDGGVFSGLISCLLILPFYKIWPNIIENEKYNKKTIFLSEQIIVTGLTVNIINFVYSVLVFIRIISTL